MSDVTIECPKCHYPFELTEALTGPMLEAERQEAIAQAEQRFATEVKTIAEEATRKGRAESEAVIAEFQRQREVGDAEVAKAREAELAARRAQQEADDAKRSVEVEIARRLAERVGAAAEQAREEVAKQYTAELEGFRNEIAAKDAKLVEAQDAEIAARRATREAEDAKREVELLVERRLDEERNRVREQALKERDDEYRLKVQEKEHQLQELRQKLDEAQRKAELGSVQRKGEVLEIDLYDMLSDAFPGDDFERVKKGQRGGDLIQTVHSASGVVSGRIKWESKRTQNWSAAWLPKLREDQRAAKCDIAALMTETLPDDVTHFDLVDGVWVSGIGTVVPMAAALRCGLMETATARRAAIAADWIKDRVYSYFTGQEFRARVQSIVEPVIEMQSSLDAEKRAAVKQFASRGKQIERVAAGLAGIYGDLQGVVGPSLPSVTGLALPESNVVDQADSAPPPEAAANAPGDAKVH